MGKTLEEIVKEAAMDKREKIKHFFEITKTDEHIKEFCDEVMQERLNDDENMFADDMLGDFLNDDMDFDVVRQKTQTLVEDGFDEFFTEEDIDELIALQRLPILVKLQKVTDKISESVVTKILQFLEELNK